MDDEGDQVLFVARLVNADADRKVWVSDYRGTRDDIRGMAQRMAFDISAELLKHAP
jgi:TolB-like protein